VGAEPVGGFEVGEPDASLPLALEPGDDPGDRDSGARFGPAGTGRNMRTFWGPGKLGDPVASAAGDVVVESVAGGSVDVESVDVDPVSSAHATPTPSPSPVATAPPIPRASASAPTRPMYFACPLVVPPADPAVCDGLGLTDEEATLGVAAAARHA
jgi:hypothetical protein